MPEFIPTTGKGGGKKSPFDFGASKDGPAYKAARGGKALGFTGSVAEILRRSAEPASAVAYLAQGKPREAAGSIADIVRQKEKVRTIGLSDVPIIREATGKLPWYLRGPTRFAFDVAGDPLTYLTFGASGVAKGAAGKTIARVGERESVALAAARATTRATRGPESLPRLNDIARAAVLTGVEKGSLDPALQVGLRLPFGRSSVTVAGVNLGKARDALARVGGRIPANEAIRKSTRESFLPTRGASKSMRHVHQSVRRAAEVEARLWQREAQDLGRRIYQRAKDNGVKPADLNRLIARHIDNPTKYPAPQFAQDLTADTRAIFERLGARELSDGVRRESRENYIPHLLLSDNDVSKYESRFGAGAMAKENPSFVKERKADTFDDLDYAGVKYETNIERLIEARAAASTTARTKLAIDEATFARFGVGSPLADTTAAQTRVDAARAKWVAATDRYRRLESTGADRSAIDAARRDVADAKAKAEAARRVVPLAPVRDAEDALAAAQDARAGITPATRPAKRAALPTSEELAAANYERGLLNRIRDEIDSQANEWRATIADARRTVQAAASAGRIDPRSFERIGRRIGALQARATSLRSSTGAMTRRQSDAYGRVIDRLATLHVMLRDAGSAPTTKQIAELGRELGRLERTAPQELQRLKVAFSKQAGKVRAAERAPKVRVAAEADAAYAQDVRRFRAERAVAEADVASATRALREARRGRDVNAIREAEAGLRSARTRLGAAQREVAYQQGRRPGELAKAKQAQSSAEAGLLRAQKPLDRLEEANRKLLDVPVSRLASSREWRDLERGWTEVPDAPRFKDARLPPAIANDLMLVHKTIGDSMKHPAAPLRFLRQIQGSWKRLALATPGFHIRNQLDDSLRAWWAGARNPQSYSQSAAILRGREGSVTVRGKRYTNDELLGMARSHGVVDVGFVAQEAASSEARHRFRSEAMRHGAGRRVNWLRGTEQLGAFREDWNRMSLFLERMKAGDNPVKAADTVRKYLFDYGDVGEFVTTARRYWIPFITYASKVIPFTAGEFARRPGHMSAIYHAQQGAWEEAGQPDISGLAPEDQLALPLPPQVAALLQRASGARTADGSEAPIMLFNPKGVFGYTLPNDLIEGVRGGGPGVQRLAGSFGSPFVTKPAELLMNHSLYNGRGYRDNELIKANAVEALLAKATGGAGFGTKKDQQTGQRNLAINPRLAILTRFLPTTNQASSLLTGVPGMQGASTSPRIGWLRTLGGVPVMPYDRARDEWYARKYGNR